jgi:hypothetical protein
MSLRKSNYLIRTILILICFQFTATVVVSGEIEKGGSHTAYTSQKSSKTSSFESLFEKTERETEEKDKIFAVDLGEWDSNHLVQALISHTCLRTDIVSDHIQKPPLYRLHCIYLI